MAHLQPTRRSVSHGALGRSHEAGAHPFLPVLRLEIPLQDVDGNVSRRPIQWPASRVLEMSAGVPSGPGSADTSRRAKTTCTENLSRSGDDDLVDDRKWLPSYRDLTCEIISMYGSESVSSVPASFTGTSGNGRRRTSSITTCSSKHPPTQKPDGTLPSRTSLESLRRSHGIPRWTNCCRSQPSGSFYHGSSETSDYTTISSPATSVTPLLGRARNPSDAEDQSISTSVIRSEVPAPHSDSCGSDRQITNDEHTSRPQPPSAPRPEALVNTGGDSRSGVSSFRRHKRNLAVPKVRISTLLTLDAPSKETTSNAGPGLTAEASDPNRSERCNSEDDAGCSTVKKRGVDLELTPSLGSDSPCANPGNDPAGESKAIRPRHSKLKLKVSRGALAKTHRPTGGTRPSHSSDTQQSSLDPDHCQARTSSLDSSEKSESTSSPPDNHPSTSPPPPPPSRSGTTTATTAATEKTAAIHRPSSHPSRRWARYFDHAPSLSLSPSPSPSAPAPPTPLTTRGGETGPPNPSDRKGRVFRRAMRRKRVTDLLRARAEASEGSLPIPTAAAAAAAAAAAIATAESGLVSADGGGGDGDDGDVKDAVDVVVADVVGDVAGDGQVGQEENEMMRSGAGLDWDKAEKPRPKAKVGGFRGRVSGWMRSAKRSIVLASWAGSRSCK
ncbi:hypothetical protein VTK26DRAFT_5763 [Humicola hyalothermophila]